MKGRLIASLVASCLSSAGAQPSGAQGGNLYVAGEGFDFPAVAQRAVAQNPSSKFFLLAVGDALRYLALTAPPDLVEVRNRVAHGGNVQFLVCQRDIDEGKYTLGDLVPGTVAVRGWPPPGSNALPSGSSYPDENPAVLPWSTDTLRRLRSTCS